MTIAIESRTQEVHNLLKARGMGGVSANDFGWCKASGQYLSEQIQNLRCRGISCRGLELPSGLWAYRLPNSLVGAE